jgi:hypothetical protein
MTIQYEVLAHASIIAAICFLISVHMMYIECLDDFRKIFKGDTGGRQGGGTAYRLSLTVLILMGVIEVCRAFDPGMLDVYNSNK